MAVTGVAAESAVRLEDDRLEVNLAALREVDSGLAERIAAAAGSDAVQMVRGSDGRVTFRLPLADPRNGEPMRGGRALWLGRTSMPSVSGEALLSRFGAAEENVLFVGAGSGYEIDRVLARAGAEQAVFVLEPSAAVLACVLRLYDWGEALRSGRLVLLHGTLGSDVLTSWLVAHPSYSLPVRVLPWPWMLSHEVTAVQSHLEVTYRQVMEARQRWAGEVSKRIRVQPAGEGEVRVVVSMARSDPEVRPIAEAVAAAARAMGWSVASCGFGGPRACAPFAQMEALAEAPTTFLLGLEHGREVAGGALPEELPVVSWRLRGGCGAGGPSGPRDWVLVAAGVGGQGSRGGSKGARVVHMPLGVVDPPKARQEVRCDVALLVDGAALSAAAHEVTTGTLVAWWDAGVRLLREHASKHLHPPRDLRGEIGRRLKVRIRDGAVLEPLERRLIARVWPTVSALHWLKVLRGRGLRVELWGRGWWSHPEYDEWWRCRSPEAVLASRGAARAVIVWEGSVLNAWLGMNAAACGAAVAWAGSRAGLERLGLKDWPGPGEIRAVGDPAGLGRWLEQRLREGRGEVKGDHPWSLRRRLERMLGLIRGSARQA